MGMRPAVTAAFAVATAVPTTRSHRTPLHRLHPPVAAETRRGDSHRTPDETSDTNRTALNPGNRPGVPLNPAATDPAPAQPGVPHHPLGTTTPRHSTIPLSFPLPRPQHPATTCGVPMEMEFDSFHHAYPALLRGLVEDPAYRNAPRGFPSREQLGIRFQLTDASQRTPLIPARRLNIVFNYAEALWYLAGRDDLDFIAYYAPSIRKYSADGIRLTGTAYGRALFGDTGNRRTGQWASVTSELRTDPDSKRAVVQIFRGEELTVPGNPDVSCTLGLQFLSRDGALHAVGFMRANDVYRGMSSDVFSFTFLQEVLARELGLRLGGYTHLAGSLHLYDPDAHRAAEVLADPASAEPPAHRFPTMPDGDNWPYIREVLHHEEALRQNRHHLGHDTGSLGLPAYWAQVLLLFELYRRLRYDDPVDEDLLAALTPPHRWFVTSWRSRELASLTAQLVR